MFKQRVIYRIWQVNHKSEEEIFHVTFRWLIHYRVNIFKKFHLAVTKLKIFTRPDPNKAEGECMEGNTSHRIDWLQPSEQHWYRTPERSLPLSAQHEKPVGQKISPGSIWSVCINKPVLRHQQSERQPAASACDDDEDVEQIDEDWQLETAACRPARPLLYRQTGSESCAHSARQAENRDDS